MADSLEQCRLDELIGVFGGRIIDVGHEEIAVREASKLKIPVVAVVDTSCGTFEIELDVARAPRTTAWTGCP